MAFYIIRTIARYEMRTLLRSWFFRIFAGMSILGLGIFNAGLNIPGSGSPWVYRAIAASIPYANLIILNLGQAIVAVFLASEFLKQDRKNDTVEVIYVRSMSNGEYIFGKTLGILIRFSYSEPGNPGPGSWFFIYQQFRFPADLSLIWRIHC